MKLVADFLSLAVMAMLVADADAGWWRGGKTCRLRYENVCSPTFPYHCEYRVVCRTDIARKRAETAARHDPNGLKTLLPKILAYYDLNDDNKVEIHGFVNTLGMTAENAKALEAADTNNDGFLSKKELMNAPFLFEQIKPDEDEDDDWRASSVEEEPKTSPPPKTTEATSGGGSKD